MSVGTIEKAGAVPAGLGKKQQQQQQQQQKHRSQRKVSNSLASATKSAILKSRCNSSNAVFSYCS